MKYLMIFLMMAVSSFVFAQRSSSSSFSSSSSRSYSSPSVSSSRSSTYSAPKITTPAPRTLVVPRATTPSTTRSSTSSTVTQPSRRTNFVPRVTPSQPLPRAVYAAGATRNGYHTYHYYSDYRSNNGFANWLPWFFLWDASDIGEDDEYAPVIATEVGGVRWNYAVPAVLLFGLIVGGIVFLTRLR